MRSSRHSIRKRSKQVCIFGLLAVKGSKISWLDSRSKWRMAVKHDPKMAEKFYRRKEKYPPHTHTYILLFIFSLDSFKIQAWLDCAFLTVLRFFFETLSRELLTLYWYRISYFLSFLFRFYFFSKGGSLYSPFPPMISYFFRKKKVHLNLSAETHGIHVNFPLGNIGL